MGEASPFPWKKAPSALGPSFDAQRDIIKGVNMRFQKG